MPLGAAQAAVHVLLLPARNVMTRVRPGLSTPKTRPARKGAQFSVLIADGDGSFRHLVRRYLGPGVVVVGEAGDGDEAVRLSQLLQPDVVLMDVAIPVTGGVEAARLIKADCAETKVVLLTSRGADTAPLHADGLLPREQVRVGILSRLGRIGRATRGGRPDARRNGRSDRRRKVARRGRVRR